jgi:hypothetical protein
MTNCNCRCFVIIQVATCLSVGILTLVVYLLQTAENDNRIMVSCQSKGYRITLGTCDVKSCYYGYIITFVINNLQKETLQKNTTIYKLYHMSFDSQNLYSILVRDYPLNKTWICYSSIDDLANNVDQLHNTQPPLIISLIILILTGVCLNIYILYEIKTACRNSRVLNIQ